MSMPIAHQIVFEQLQAEDRQRRCRCGCGCRHRNSDPTTGHCRPCDAGDCPDENTDATRAEQA